MGKANTNGALGGLLPAALAACTRNTEGGMMGQGVAHAWARCTTYDHLGSSLRQLVP